MKDCFSNIVTLHTQSEAFKMMQRSFGGGYLAEGDLARFIYIDEAGTSVREPVTVVAGAFMNPDKDWTRANEYFAGVRNDVPEEIRSDPKALHATELYSGGKAWNREKYDRGIRWPILKKVVSASRMLNIPIVVAYNRKHQEETWDKKNELFIRHLVAFLECLKAANVGMKGMFPSERAMIVAEDHAEMRQWLAGIPAMLRSASAPEFFAGPHPFDSIVDTIHFTSKEGAPLLQLADATAFAVRHYLSGHRDGLWLMQEMTGCDDVEPMFAKARDNPMASFVLDWRKGGRITGSGHGRFGDIIF